MTFEVGDLVFIEHRDPASEPIYRVLKATGTDQARLGIVLTYPLTRVGISERMQQILLGSIAFIHPSKLLRAPNLVVLARIATGENHALDLPLTEFVVRNPIHKRGDARQS